MKLSKAIKEVMFGDGSIFDRLFSIFYGLFFVGTGIAIGGRIAERFLPGIFNVFALIAGVVILIGLVLLFIAAIIYTMSIRGSTPE